MYDNEFSARWSDFDLIRKREQTCVGLCTFRLGSLLVCTIKDTTPFTNEYLTRVSNYLRAVKRTTKITCERLLVSLITREHYSESFACIPTRASLEYSKTTREYSKTTREFSSRFVEARRRTRVRL